MTGNDSKRGILFSGDPELDSTPILQLACQPRSKRKHPGLLCSCPPAEKNRLGGCQPVLVHDGPVRVKPICKTCLKPLARGHHNRVEQRHVITLSELPPEHLDFSDLKAAGLLIDLVEVAEEAGGAVPP